MFKLRWPQSFGLIALAALLLAAPSPAAASVSPDGARTQPSAGSLERQVRDWTEALSAEKPFQAWHNAVPHIHALGPGLHGWLVTLHANGATVGYMVVYAVAGGGYRLGEYGTGPNTLFSTATLKRSLKENGLLPPDGKFRAVKHYLHPFAAAWEVQAGDGTYWLDAKSGEQLPLDKEAWARLERQQSGRPDGSPAVKPTGVLLNESFDPYERLPWLMDEKPLPVSADRLTERLRKGLHLRYVSEPFGDAMLYALPVVGYQAWTGGQLHLAVDMNGTRFIPLDSLQEHGRFYQ
jgi:hypothetical protein